MANWELGPLTQKVHALFAAALKGDQQVLWVTLETATGKPRHELNGAVQTARRHMVRDHGVEFKNLRGIGFRALADNEQADAVNYDVGRIRRIGQRRQKRAERVDPNRLTADERLRHFGGLLRLEQVAKAASAGTAKKISNALRGTHNMKSRRAEAAHRDSPRGVEEVAEGAMDTAARKLRNAAIVAHYKAGESVGAIAARFNLWPQRVAGILQEHAPSTSNNPSQSTQRRFYRGGQNKGGEP